MKAPKRSRLVCAAISLSVTVSAAACVRYQPRPLDISEALDRYQARTLLDVGLAGAVAPAHPAVWPPPVWDLQSLTFAGLYFHPDLAVARASWALARAGLVIAGERPNPDISAGPGYNSSTPPNTITPWILNFNLDFTIETAGKRRIRVAQADHLAESARYKIADTAWQIRARLRQALLDLFTATETAAALDRQRLIQENNVVLFQRQLDAGEISRFQMSQARLMLNTLRLSLLDSQRQQRDARVRIGTAIGVSSSVLDDVRFAFDVFRMAPADLPDVTARRQALTNRADILAALADYEASQAALQLEIARQYPDIHLGPGYQMDQNSNKWTLLLGAALPIFNRNQGRIAEAEARRLVAAAQVDAVQARALGAIERALSAYRAALAKVAMADQMIGELQAAEQTGQRQLTAGEISQLDLGIVQVELAGRELARLEALAQAQQALGDIEDAMQRPVDLPVDPLPRRPQ